MKTLTHNRLAVISVALLTTGCSSFYYATMEKFGYAKRDLLVERVEEARDSQDTAKQEIQTTFEAFKSLTGFDGGELESKYNELNSKLESSRDAASDVSSRILSIEKVAGDMFAEWGDEVGEIQNPELRAKSENLKAQTEKKYGELIGAMKKAEGRMEPVLTAFNDQVLFLKHNLNAAAITSLQTEVGKIESTVASLVAEMQASIDEANEFIGSLSS